MNTEMKNDSNKIKTALDAVLAARKKGYVEYFRFFYQTLYIGELEFCYQGQFWVDGEPGFFQWCYDSFESLLDGFVEETGKTFREMLQSLPPEAVDILMDDE